MPRYKAVIFDLDGTLLDTLDDLTAACNHALSVHGFPTHTREEVKGFVGNGIRLLMGRALPEGREDALPSALAEFKAYYAAHNAVYTAPYPGIPELLTRLKAAGKKLVVATSKPEDFSLRILEHFELLQYFDFVSGACMDETRTQKWEVIRWAQEQFCHPGDRVLMVGDRKHDVEGARRCGLPCLGVLYGYGGRAELENAGAIGFAASPEEIGHYILN